MASLQCNRFCDSRSDLRPVFLAVEFKQFVLLELGVDVACLILLPNFLVEEHSVIEYDVLVLPRPPDLVLYFLFLFGGLFDGGDDAPFPPCDFHHLVSLLLLDYHLPPTFLALVLLLLVLGSRETSLVLHLLARFGKLWFFGRGLCEFGFFLLVGVGVVGDAVEVLAFEGGDVVVECPHGVHFGHGPALHLLRF